MLHQLWFMAESKDKMEQAMWEAGRPVVPQELAALLGIPEGTVASRLWRGARKETGAPFQRCSGGTYIPAQHPQTGEPLTVMIITRSEAEAILKARQRG